MTERLREIALGFLKLGAATLKVMLAGAVVGAVRSRVAGIPALRTLLGSAT